MRNPSTRVLNLTADLYRFDATRSGAVDADGGITDACFPSLPDVVAIPCAYSPDYRSRDELGQSRATETETGMVLFGADPGLKLNDKLVISSGEVVFTDGGGTNMADRGACWGVPVRDRI